MTAAEPSNSYLARLVDVLEVLGQGPAKSLSDVASEAGVPPSTAHRLLTLLMERGYARRVDGSLYFVMGPALERIGLRALPRRPEERLDTAVLDVANLTGESVSLGVVQQNQIYLVSRHESSRLPRLTPSPLCHLSWRFGGHGRDGDGSCGPRQFDLTATEAAAGPSPAFWAETFLEEHTPPSSSRSGRIDSRSVKTAVELVERCASRCPFWTERAG